MNSSTPAFPVLHHLPEFAHMHVHWVSDPPNHLIFCYPLLLLSSIFPSIKIFPKESALHIRWPKYWSFSFSISPSNEYSGLISFWIDCFFSPCCPRDPQGSFRAQQFKCISSSVLSLLYGPILTSISIYSSVQSLSHVRLFATTWTAARQASLSITNPQFTQTHIYWVGDAILPSHPLPSPSPPASNLSQHQGLFQWVNSSHEVAKVLEYQLQHQSFQWIPRTDLL